MNSSQTKHFVKLSMLFSLVILANCVTPSSNPVISTSSPIPTTSSDPSITSSPTPMTSASPEISLPSSSSNPMPTPTASQSSGGQTNIGSSNSLTLQSDFLKVSFVDYFSADLKWSSVTGAKSYRIYQDGKVIADNITGLAYSVKNLTPNTDYTFEISAVNETGESNKSMLKVRTFIPGNSSSGSNNSGSNNQGTVITPSPSANIQFNGGYN